MIRRTYILLAATALGAIAAASPAMAQSAAPAASEQQRSFSIPAGRLSQSVLALSEQAGVQVVFDSDTTGSVSGNAVSGSLTLTQALNQLLGGTGLSWRWLRTGVVTIEAASTDGERVTGAVRVEGAQGSPYFGGAGRAAGVNGINGSRDITATEGTGSFTSGALTIGSKVPQALKDVPQSISVLTSERLEQQNVTDFTTAMKQLPGITLVQGGSSIESTFYSRGFAVTDIQVDGGAPLTTSYSFYPQLDMSIYDHVEVLRGASGTFSGFGDPSGTVNLVRKKPLDHGQIGIEAQAGSWSNYRIVADITSPLALAGALRGRLVTTYQKRRYFYEDARDERTLIYGIAELDATPTTLLTAGINYTQQNSVPWFGGLPRYLDGGDIGLPRSTAVVFNWNRWRFDTTELFGGIEQKLFGDWTANLNLTRNRQSNTRKIGYSSGAVNPNNRLGPVLAGAYNKYASDQFSSEFMISGGFMLLGQRQEVVIGVNRVKSNGAGLRTYSPLVSGTAAMPYQSYPGGLLYYTGSPNGSSPSIDVFAFDPDDLRYTEPRNTLPFLHYPIYGQVKSVAYASLRLTAFDRLHLTPSIRWSRYKSVFSTEYYCTTLTGACLGRQIGDISSTAVQNSKSSKLSWPPSVALSFDVTKQLTMHLGYADIYQNQGDVAIMADGKPIPPITGSNWETSLKWSPGNGKLNISLAAYRIRKAGFAILDGFRQDLGGGRSCCWIVNPERVQTSQGIDFDVSGELRPGWQVAASYSYNENEQVGSYFAANEGLPIVSIAPRHLYKLWSSYDFGAAGHSGVLTNLTISGGINGQSSGFRSGTTCVNLVGDPNPITGAQSCASNTAPDRITYNFTVPPHAVFSGRIDYRMSDRWSLAINLENIFDKTYYQTVGVGVTGGHWYGAPRSVTATLRAKW